MDVDAVDALVQALVSYQGTLVFISHDIHFVRSVANVVYEVSGETEKAGSHVRKFYGNFDYYLEKKAEGEVSLRVKKIKTQDEKKDEIKSEREKAKEEERLKKEEERGRKSHNTAIGAKIQKLNKEKEELELESYAKSRALSDPQTYSNQEKARDYGQRLKAIEKRCREISLEIAEFEKKLL